jgi:cyclopropane fatty-acyl-phospholipid synthase-like methyltransferase
VIRGDGWDVFSIWEHSATIKDLYARRCRREAEEMTAHAQAAKLLGERVTPGDSVLDAGCGSGYFFHSLATRGIAVEYWGVDSSHSLIGIGRSIMPAFGLPGERLLHLRLEDLVGEVDHVVCMNVLSNIDNYHRPLERLLTMARKTVILRESLTRGSHYQYVKDAFLDDGVNLRVHVNHYDLQEVMAFIRAYGFDVASVVDIRTGGRPERVIDYEHYWTFLVADRTQLARRDA